MGVNATISISAPKQPVQAWQLMKVEDDFLHSLLPYSVCVFVKSILHVKLSTCKLSTMIICDQPAQAAAEQQELLSKYLKCLIGNLLPQLEEGRGTTGGTTEYLTQHCQ